MGLVVCHLDRVIGRVTIVLGEYGPEILIQVYKVYHICF